MSFVYVLCFLLSFLPREGVHWEDECREGFYLYLNINKFIKPFILNAIKLKEYLKQVQKQLVLNKSED